jgi:endonuclease V-like protein UPF0215 family
MNAYTTRGQARIQQRDVAAVLRVNRPAASAALVALERQRGWQADAELDCLLKQNRIESLASPSRASLVRQAIGTMLVHAGERVMGASRNGDSPEPTRVAGRLGIAG